MAKKSKRKATLTGLGLLPKGASCKITQHVKGARYVIRCKAYKLPKRAKGKK